MKKILFCAILLFGVNLTEASNQEMNSYDLVVGCNCSGAADFAGRSAEANGGNYYSAYFAAYGECVGRCYE
jgi:hypothetical protein